MKKHWFWVCLAIVFILGIFLRLNFFIHANNFEDDECRLLLTMLDKNLFQLFLPLGDAQSAPPLFVVWSKILMYIFGLKEYVMKFTPFAASITSIFVFYKLCTKFLNKKISILAACFLFSIARSLINFSSLFKQYSTDVLIALLCLYFLPNIDFYKLNKKQMGVLLIIFVLLPLFSLPAAFFIGTFFIINFLKHKNRKIILFFIPFCIFFLIYYFFNLAPSKELMDAEFPHYWRGGFANLFSRNIISVLCYYFKYIFYPNLNTLFEFILFLGGICMACKEKTRYGIFMLVCLGLIILASYLHLYPLMMRVALYAMPIFILFTIKPLDLNNKIIFPIVLIFLFLGFMSYNTEYFTKTLTPDSGYQPRKLMVNLKENFKPNDVILCNNASASSYLLYSSILGLDTDDVYEMDIRPVDYEHAYTYLNNLKRGRRFWIFMVKDYVNFPVYPYILDWTKTQKILYKYKINDSYLFLIQR